MRNKLILIFVLAVLVHALISLGQIMATRAPDFGVYYYAAQSLAFGNSPYEAKGLFTGLGYPPFSLYPFLSLVFLPYRVAQGLFVALSLAFSVYLVYLLFWQEKKRFGWAEVSLFWAFSFLSFPVKFTLGMGQSNLVALFFLVLGRAVINPLVAAVFLGTAFLIKPHLLLILPFLALSGKKSALGYAMLFLGAVIMLGGLITGWQGYGRYFSVEAPALAHFSGREIYYNQGLAAFFSRLVAPDIAQWLWIVFSLAVSGVNFWLSWQYRRLALPLGLLTLLLVEPLSWQHHYVFLMPLFVWLYLAWPKLTGSEQWLFFLSYLLISLNIARPEKFGHLLVSPLILSHVFGGSLLLLALVYKLIRRRVNV